MADNENTILTEENESTRIINLSEASEMDAGMYFVTDSSNGTRKVPITKLIDADLEDEYAAAPAKAVGDLKEEFDNFSGLSDDVKLALLQIASKVAYIDDDGQDYYDALYDALYPPANLVSISAVYTQSGTVYDTDSLDYLKEDLVVTATYDDASTETVTAYTLSGTLTVGTSTITVSYGGKTTTFNVTVSEDIQGLLNRWDLKTSYTDDINNVVAESIDGATSTALPITSSGVTMDSSRDALLFPNIFGYSRRIEIDVASAVGDMSENGGNKGSVYGFGNGSLVKFYDSDSISTDGTASTSYAIVWRGQNDAYYIYAHNSWRDSLGDYMDGPNSISGKTLWFEIDADGYITFGMDDTTIKKYGTAVSSGLKSLKIGNNVTTNGQAWHDMTVTGVRVYDLTA